MECGLGLGLELNLNACRVYMCILYAIAGLYANNSSNQACAHGNQARLMFCLCPYAQVAQYPPFHEDVASKGRREAPTFTNRYSHTVTQPLHSHTTTPHSHTTTQSHNHFTSVQGRRNARMHLTLRHSDTHPYNRPRYVSPQRSYSDWAILDGRFGSPYRPR